MTTLSGRQLADRGYFLLPHSAAGWPNFAPDLIDELAIQAAVEEQENGCAGGLMPIGAPGSCTTCQHHQICHYLCRWACEVAGCPCRKPTPTAYVQWSVGIAPDGTLLVRDRAQVRAEALRRLEAQRAAAPQPGGRGTG
jgi:hypothetical protein